MAEPAPGRFEVEVVYALPERQISARVDVREGATAADAAASSGLDRRVPGLELVRATYGVFGKAVPATYRLRPGDRVELLRPLLADPKEVRRALAAEGKTMGKPRGRDGG